MGCCCSCLQPQCFSTEPVGGLQKAFSLKDLRNSAIVLNLNGFRALRTDGCVHSQIRRSIVQNLLFSPSNHILSFSHCCLLQPLYHSASLHTLYMYTHKRTSRSTHRFTLSSFSPPLPISQHWDKEIVFLSLPIRSAQLHKPASTLLSLCLSHTASLFPFFLLLRVFKRWNKTK